jgi:ribose transport system ATP-binding protein
MSQQADQGQSTTPAQAILARGVVKHFAGELALDGVDFELRPGEIHALLGENGAGKSTLIKILAGVVPRDEGDIELGGRHMPQHYASADVTNAGVAFVHQDLGLLDHLSVSENIALAVGYAKRGRLISYAQTARQARSLLDDLGVSIAPHRLVAELAQDEKVMVAVARAFALKARAIVLDEVSSSLPAPEVDRLLEALRTARAAGVGYVYVTHRLREVFAVADRLTVLRDGRLVVTTEVEGLDHDQLVEWIVGTPPTFETGVSEPSVQARVVKTTRLRVSALRGPGLAEPVSFDAAQGEVVGICGLVGCGARELAAVLGGAAPVIDGHAELDGQPLSLGSPAQLRDAGCTYVPGDRQAEGAVLGMTIRENLFLSRRGSTAAGMPDQPTPAAAPDGASPIIRPRRERSRARDLMNRFDVRPRTAADRPLSTLSGGNQQKVICGRALRANPKMIVVDDPTAGVDVASRAQLHSILRTAAESGTTIMFASTDFDEIASEADRALVMVGGRVSETLSGADLTPERLSRASYGKRAQESAEGSYDTRLNAR